MKNTISGSFNGCVAEMLKGWEINPFGRCRRALGELGTSIEESRSVYKFVSVRLACSAVICPIKVTLRPWCFRTKDIADICFVRIRIDDIACRVSFVRKPGRIPGSSGS